MESTKIEVRVSNLDCEHDAANIERGLDGFSGLVGLKVYPKSAKVALTFDPDQTNPSALKQKLETLGFPPQKGMEMAEQPKPWKNPKVLTAFASGVLLLVGWLIGLAGAPELISTIIFIAAILIGGYYFGREAIEELIFERQIGIELPRWLLPRWASRWKAPCWFSSTPLAKLRKAIPRRKRAPQSRL